MHRFKAGWAFSLIILLTDCAKERNKMYRIRLNCEMISKCQRMQGDLMIWLILCVQPSVAWIQRQLIGDEAAFEASFKSTTSNVIGRCSSRSPSPTGRVSKFSCGEIGWTSGRRRDVPEKRSDGSRAGVDPRSTRGTSESSRDIAEYCPKTVLWDVPRLSRSAQEHKQSERRLPRSGLWRYVTLLLFDHHQRIYRPHLLSYSDDLDNFDKAVVRDK